MYYRSGTGGCCCMGTCWQTFCVYSPGGGS